MVFQDYYAVLGLKPSATAAEIKTNYRKLAMKYHPDKNEGNALAAAIFRDIAEAYTILSNPITRREYDSIYAGDVNARFNQSQPLTKDVIITRINNLQRNIAASNPFRINQDALWFAINQMLSPLNLGLLKQTDVATKRLAIEQLLRCSVPLSYRKAQKLGGSLLNLAGDDEFAQIAINQFLKKSQRSSNWHKYKALIAVIAAVILCLLMFLLS